MSLKALEEERDYLKRELQGVTEMLAHVLSKTGAVEITKEDITNGLDGQVIRVDENLENDSFVFSLVEAE